MESTRSSNIRQGITVEILTIVWMVIEMAASIAAGIAARSVLLTAFGIDSLIELVSGAVLLWRLTAESKQGDLESVELAEQRAAWVVAVTLGLLCLYVLCSSLAGLLWHSQPENSLPGIGIALAAIVIMPILAISKRRIAARIDSQALAGDAVNSWTCAYMAGTVLVGLLLNMLFGWWWIEYVAAIIFLFWLVRETWEAFEEARGKARQEDI
ncbi:MAG TPA: cation transporter [Anaerolineales bacterium]|nr:cation transporter [Anaerolineales bacterium]